MYHQEPSDHEGYELFRRAIIRRDHMAWGDIYTRYQPLLVLWARQSSARAPAGEPYEDLADRAFSRAWLALTPEQFAQFPSLAALLGYLRTCVSATVIDSARAAATRERTQKKLELPPVLSPEEAIVHALSRSELWRVINTLVTSQREQIILFDSFVLGLPPRMIFARHREQFADIPEVYTVKRNLINRLERNLELQQLCREFLAA